MILLQAATAGASAMGDEQILIGAAKLAIQIRNVMLNFAPMFVIVVGIWGVIRFYVGYEQGGRINFQKYVWYPLIMLFAILQYAWIMDTINTITFGAVNSTQNEHSDEMFEKIMDAERQYTMMVSAGQMIYADSVKDVKDKKVDEENKDSPIWGKILKAKNWAVNEFNKTKASMDFAGSIGVSPPSPTNILDFLKGSLQAGFTMLCRSVIILIRKALFMILLVIGPIAMTFEILPHWRGQFVHWLKIYVGVILWGLTINVIDAVYIFYINTECKDVINDISAMAKNGEYFFSSTDSDFGYLSVVFALMYIFVPYITSIYAGGAGAGKVFTVMGGLAMKGITGAAGAAGGMIPSGGGSKISGRTRSNN